MPILFKPKHQNSKIAERFPTLACEHHINQRAGHADLSHRTNGHNVYADEQTVRVVEDAYRAALLGVSTALLCSAKSSVGPAMGMKLCLKN